MIPPFISRQFLTMMNIQQLVRRNESSFPIGALEYKDGARAAFCMSMDFDNRSRMLTQSSPIIDRSTSGLLNLAKKYNVRISWAICGITAMQQESSFHQIMESGHDVGVHTFSHMYLDDPTLTREEVKKDIQKCIDFLGTASKPRVFIFPSNREGSFDVLKEFGFIAYRGRMNRLGPPAKENGLWNIHPVCYINERWYGSSSILKRLVDLAIAYRGVFHVWSHPWSITVDDDPEHYSRDVLEPLFEYVDRKRKAGLLWACTLSELANYCENNWETSREKVGG